MCVRHNDSKGLVGVDAGYDAVRALHSRASRGPGVEVIRAEHARDDTDNQCSLPVGDRCADLAKRRRVCRLDQSVVHRRAASTRSPTPIRTIDMRSAPVVRGGVGGGGRGSRSRDAEPRPRARRDPARLADKGKPEIACPAARLAREAMRDGSLRWLARDWAWRLKRPFCERRLAAWTFSIAL